MCPLTLVHILCKKDSFSKSESNINKKNKKGKKEKKEEEMGMKKISIAS